VIHRARSLTERALDIIAPEPERSAMAARVDCVIRLGRILCQAKLERTPSEARKLLRNYAKALEAKPRPWLANCGRRRPHTFPTRTLSTGCTARRWRSKRSLKTSRTSKGCTVAVPERLQRTASSISQSETPTICSGISGAGRPSLKTGHGTGFRTCFSRHTAARSTPTCGKRSGIFIRRGRSA
jgi:hypothetical protein